MMRIYEIHNSIWCLCYGFLNTHCDSERALKSVVFEKIQKCFAGPTVRARANQHTQRMGRRAYDRDRQTPPKTMEDVENIHNTHTLTHTLARHTLSPSAFVRALPPCYYHLRDTLHTTAALCVSLRCFVSLPFCFVSFCSFVPFASFVRVCTCSRLIAIRSITAGMMMHTVALDLYIASLTYQTKHVQCQWWKQTNKRMKEHNKTRNTPTIWTIMRGKGSSEFQHQLWHSTHFYATTQHSALNDIVGSHFWLRIIFAFQFDSKFALNGNWNIWRKKKFKLKILL